MGNTGSVIGIDLADRWLGVAKERTISAGLVNVEYRVGNTEAMEFDDASFDAVICASSIVRFSDILKALIE